MTSEELNQRFIYTPRFFIYLSLTLHVFVLLSFWSSTTLNLFNLTLFGKKRELVKDVYQDFIQVDVVALPEQLLSEKLGFVDTTLPIVDKAGAETKPPESVVPKPEEKIMPDPALLEQKRLEELKIQEEQQKRLEEMRKQEEAKKLKEQKELENKERDQALKRLQDEANREAALKSLAKEQKKGKEGRVTLKGNILSKGTGTTGKIGNATDRCLSLVKQKIKQHFNVYPWQIKKGLVSVVLINVRANGTVKDKKVMKPSKDSLYDSGLLQAIEEAQPLPIGEGCSFVDDGIAIEFRADE